MRAWIITLLTGVVITLTASHAEHDRFGVPTNLQEINMERFNYFDSELLQKLGVQNNDNFVISTASIKSILGLLTEAAQGKTYEELVTIMRLPENQKDVQTVLHEFQSSLNNSNDMITMRSANRIFVSQNLTPDPRYKKLIKDYYRADIDRTNFATPELTALNINNWVKSHTHGFITKLIDPASIQPQENLILANAIYFKGDWQEEFLPERTMVECFYPTPEFCKKAYMMSMTANINHTYYPALNAQAIQLPYQGGKYSMIVILPTKRNNIFNLNRDLSHRSIKDIVRTMAEREIMLKLPRFSIEFKSDLVPVLKSMGIQDLFSETSNLPGIVLEQKPAQVNAFLHTAKIEVNEKGTKAGAASAASVVTLMSTYVPQFIADHPFFFYIYDQETNTILFSGRLTAPDVVDESNQLGGAEILSSPVHKKPTIVSNEPYSRQYPYTDNKPMHQTRSVDNSQNEKFISFPA
uniref:Serpin domain-containing protein n=2 Tax=Clastoptera arizonana TaxID=38151 RepID=A0A1B6DVY9_9HEMI